MWRLICNPRDTTRFNTLTWASTKTGGISWTWRFYCCGKAPVLLLWGWFSTNARFMAIMLVFPEGFLQSGGYVFINAPWFNFKNQFYRIKSLNFLSVVHYRTLKIHANNVSLLSSFSQDNKSYKSYGHKVVIAPAGPRPVNISMQ